MLRRMATSGTRKESASRWITSATGIATTTCLPTCCATGGSTPGQNCGQRRIAGRRASDEGQEGLKAFLEKRKPGWMGSDLES